MLPHQSWRCCRQTTSERFQFSASLLVYISLFLTPIQVLDAAPPLEFLLSASKLAANTSADQSSYRLASVLANSSHTHDNDLVDLHVARLAWSRMEQEYRSYMNKRINATRPTIMDLLSESNVSASCRDSISGWLDGLGELDQWATLMWNSWGDFPPSGFFEGSFTDLGSYRSCLGVERNQIIGEPQYCTLDFQPIVPSRPRFHSIFKQVLDIDQEGDQMTAGDFGFEASIQTGSQVASHEVPATKFRNNNKTNSSTKNATLSSKQGQVSKRIVLVELAERAHFFYYVKLRTGSCWPTKCSQQEVQMIAQTAGTKAVLQATEVFCVTKTASRSFSPNGYQMFSILVLTTLLMFPIMAAILDLTGDLARAINCPKLENFVQIFESFLDVCSIQRNFNKLTRVSEPPLTVTTTAMTDGKQQVAPCHPLSCLPGLRVLSIIWIIYGHTILNLDYQSFSHAFRTLDNDLPNFLILPTLIPNFGVDTFFVISGLLSAYIIFSLKVEYNPVLYTVARYARMTPQLIIVILMFFILPLAGDGPLYKQGTDVHADRCFKNFWLNLLYLQTYVNRKEMCIIPSWWLSIEMTFHFLSLGVIALTFKRPNLGIFSNISLITVMTLIGAYMHYVNGFAIQYLPSIPQKYEVEFEQTQHFFHRPYPHTASYFIGFATGYIIAKKSIVTFSNWHLIPGWSLCAFGLAVPLWGTYYWNLGAPYTQLQATVYYNLCQVLWPISVAWIILASSLGYGGVLNRMLSAKFFALLGRITYMTYLSHILIVYYYAASRNTTIELSSVNLFYICSTNIMLSLAFGALLTLIYEAPILNLQKLIIRRKYTRVSDGATAPNGLSNQLTLDCTPCTEKMTESRSNGNHLGDVRIENQSGSNN